MRACVASVACVILPLSAAGCNLTDGQYLKNGVGTDLSSPDLPNASVLQDQYIAEICQQAGLAGPASDPASCPSAQFTPTQWMIFVQAGMNDIDKRCDAYLAWLDDKKRWYNPILQEIANTQSATQTIMGAAGAASPSITIVGAAFGLATNTFTNINSRLILEVDHSTVQTQVLTSQNKYRLMLQYGDPTTKTPPPVIASRPVAIYVLRSYLRICMPFTIETAINTTVSGVNGIGDAPTNRTSLITPATVSKPLTAQQTISAPQRAPLGSLPAYAQIIKDYDPKAHTTSIMQPRLKALCVPESEVNSISSKTSALIQVFQQAILHPATGQLTEPEMAILDSRSTCVPTDRVRNYYERSLNGVDNPDVITALSLPKSSAIPDIRSKIVEVRNSLGTKLKIRNRYVSDQYTRDLNDELFKPSTSK